MPIKATERKAAAKKTTQKVAPKAASKIVSKPVEKKIEVKKESITKPHVVVETKKTEDDVCKTNSCPCKCCMKCLISVLVLLNLIVAIALFVKTCKHSAWNIEAIKDGGKANMENVIKLYESDYYVSNQAESISSYLEQLSAN